MIVQVARRTATFPGDDRPLEFRTRKAVAHPTIFLLLENLAHSFDRRSWHGPNLMGSFRGVRPAEAAWRPQPDRHNIWEYVVHAAYWKYRVVRLLDVENLEPFTYPGSNFFERPVEATVGAFKSDVATLVAWHQKLLVVVEAVDPESLDHQPGRREFSNRQLILGAAAHDVYHAGQIRLIRRMYGEQTQT